MWYGEAVIRRQIVKITSGDVRTRVPLRLSRRSLAFYYSLVSRTLHYESISLVLTTHFKPSWKIKYSIIKTRSKIIVSLSFVQKI